MPRMMTDAAILREIESTPTRPEDIRYMVGIGERAELAKRVKGFELDGRLYRKRWHGLTVYGVNWYPQQGKTDESAAA